jgi:hypothetical protein
MHIKHTAHLIFTRDFHELLRGRLSHGSNCTISFDPARIVPAGDPYQFGDPNRPVIAHIQFGTAAPVFDLPLESRVGIQEYVPKTFMGEGPMLTGVFKVPDEANKVIIWFTFVSSDGQTCFDTEYGQNYEFRFLHRDFKLLDSAVTGKSDDPLHRFGLQVEADESIERITIRYRVVNGSDPKVEKEADLQRTEAHTGDGCSIWTIQDILVPYNAVVAFDLRYLIDGRWIKSDNQGNYYLATHLEKLAKMQT